MRTATGKSFLDFKKQTTTAEFPDAFARYVREYGDVFHWPTGGFHVVTAPDLAKKVLKDEAFSADRSQFFISRMPNMDLRLIGDFFSVVQKMMVMSDGQEHAQRRRGAALGLEDHILERFAGRVKESITRILENAYSKTEFEFVEEVAKKLPSTVLADLFSIPEADRRDFFEWSNQMTAFFGGATTYENPDGVRVNFAASKLRDYFRALFQSRRARPGDDYASMLIKAQARFNLSEDEIVSQAIMMLVAGSVTTTDQICNCAYLLAANPGLQDQLRATPDNLPNALEELKRYDPAVTFLFRVAKQDIMVGPQPVKAGETVFISNHAVNRDPNFDNSDQLDIQRKVNPAAHFAYGHGAHYCLGAKLGRQQMQLLFQAMLARGFRLNPKGQQERDHYSLSFSGFKRLDLMVDAHA